MALTSTPTPKEDPIAQHRRTFLRKVALPFALGGLSIVALIALSVLALGRRDVSLLADWMLSCLCLLPLLIILFPVYLLLVVAAFTLGKADRFTTRQVRRARVMTEKLSERTRETSLNLSRRSIGFNARLAPLDRLFNVFDRPSSSTDGELNVRE